MVTYENFKEFIYIVILIAGFSVTGFFVGKEEKASEISTAPAIMENPHPVRLVANPVVHITVPEHNIFAK